MADTLTSERPDPAAFDLENAKTHDPHATNTGLTHNKLGMWLFLGSEALLFGGLISTFLLYKSKLVEITNPNDAAVLTRVTDLGVNIYDIPFTSVSSFVLLMSSLTMVLALAAIQRDDVARSRLWILTTAVLGSTFVAGQVYEFTVFAREGMKWDTNIFSSAFYTLTGFHGVHVTIGILLLLSLVVASLKGGLRKKHSETVELVGLYWHFVDVVWILIFVVVYLIPVAQADASAESGLARTGAITTISQIGD